MVESGSVIGESSLVVMVLFVILRMEYLANLGLEMGAEEVDTWEIGAFCLLFVYMDGHADGDRGVSVGWVMSK
jgi:hypothetical protein